MHNIFITVGKTSKSEQKILTCNLSLQKWNSNVLRPGIRHILLCGKCNWLTAVFKWRFNCTFYTTENVFTLLFFFGGGGINNDFLFRNNILTRQSSITYTLCKIFLDAFLVDFFRNLPRVQKHFHFFFLSLF